MFNWIKKLTKRNSVKPNERYQAILQLKEDLASEENILKYLTKEFRTKFETILKNIPSDQFMDHFEVEADILAYQAELVIQMKEKLRSLTIEQEQS